MHTAILCGITMSLWLFKRNRVVFFRQITNRVDEWPYKNFFAIEEKCPHPLCTVGFVAGRWPNLERGQRMQKTNREQDFRRYRPLVGFWVGFVFGDPTWKRDRGCKRPTGNRTFGLPWSFLTFGYIGSLSDFVHLSFVKSQSWVGDRECKSPNGN